MTEILDAKPCPLCGGEAKIARELNCDTLWIQHESHCYISNLRREDRFHWNLPDLRPKEAFADWNTRALSAGKETGK